MGRPIVHFEIASPNLDRATEFYRELFDWDVGGKTASATYGPQPVNCVQ